jgi:Uncharacterised protein family UPF0547
MLIAFLIFLLGIALIVGVPVLGLIPGILLIVVAVVVAILALLGRGIGAIAGIGAEKTCPQCRTKVPSDAVVCRYCGYRWE